MSTPPQKSSGEPWSPEEDAKLLKHYDAMVAKMEGRSEAAVRARINKIVWRRDNPQTPEPTTKVIYWEV